MGLFDDIKNKADGLKDKAQGHEDQINEGIDKAGDAFDEKTGGKYSDQVDKAQDALKGQFEKPENNEEN